MAGRGPLQISLSVMAACSSIEYPRAVAVAVSLLKSLKPESRSEQQSNTRQAALASTPNIQPSLDHVNWESSYAFKNMPVIREFV